MHYSLIYLILTSRIQIYSVKVCLAKKCHMLCVKDKSIEGFAEYVCCFVTSNYTAGISQQASECQTEVFIDCYLFLLTHTHTEKEHIQQLALAPVTPRCKTSI